MPPDRPLLEVVDLRTHLVSRDGERIVRAVDGVSFTLARGETLGIVGESGCGKSMTINSIIRLLPQGARIVGGEIRFGGENLLEKSEREMQQIRGKRMSVILQDPMVALDPLFTIGDQIMEPLRIHRAAARPDMRRRAVELLKAVGIPAPERRLGQHPHEMSGGMLQRIVGAIAISCDPELLIADEPTTALDPTIQAQFLDLLAGLRDTTGLSLIVVTHDFGVAARLCDRVMVMYAGRIVEMGPTAEIFDNPQHPYTRALLASMVHLDRALPPALDRGRTARRLPTIAGQPPDLAHLPPGCAFSPRCSEAGPRCLEAVPATEKVGQDHLAACWMRLAS